MLLFLGYCMFDLCPRGGWILPFGHGQWEGWVQNERVGEKGSLFPLLLPCWASIWALAAFLFLWPWLQYEGTLPITRIKSQADTAPSSGHAFSPHCCLSWGAPPSFISSSVNSPFIKPSSVKSFICATSFFLLGLWHTYNNNENFIWA